MTVGSDACDSKTFRGSLWWSVCSLEAPCEGLSLLPIRSWKRGSNIKIRAILDAVQKAIQDHKLTLNCGFSFKRRYERSVWGEHIHPTPANHQYHGALHWTLVDQFKLCVDKKLFLWRRSYSRLPGLFTSRMPVDMAAVTQAGWERSAYCESSHAILIPTEILIPN